MKVGQFKQWLNQFNDDSEIYTLVDGDYCDPIVIRIEDKNKTIIGQIWDHQFDVDFLEMRRVYPYGE